MTVRRRLVITGRVQGVFFRQWTVERARALGLAGWVRNRGDGSVEAVIDGPADAIDAMIAAARLGPAAARVDDVVVSEAPDEVLSGFEKRATL